ncbi:MAG TPA: HD domain-containing protein [Candidatus Hydrogenedentes bacterium]|nr:HD domain-containing protein [Candidatus Hydrogenedentota bacterium]HIJ74867.1 HD domain-containing protein [Candidatus Hydrogenedentota bacterium]
MDRTQETFSERVVQLFESIHPLDRVPRAGYVLRGVPEPESVAAHSHFVALLTLLFVEEHPTQFDRSKALAMALIHDLSEAKLMDIPMPYGDTYLKEGKQHAEQAVIEDLFAGFPRIYAAWHRELHEALSPEAKLVRALDKAQMMLKIAIYEREGRGRLAEFWANPKNFDDQGVECVSALFDAICARAGHPRPTPISDGA